MALRSGVVLPVCSCIRSRLSTLTIGLEDSLSELPERTVDSVFFCAGNSAAFRTDDDPEYCLRRNVLDLHGYLTEAKYRDSLRQFLEAGNVDIEREL
jgi:hypothetical protein